VEQSDFQYLGNMNACEDVGGIPQKYCYVFFLQLVEPTGGNWAGPEGTGALA
jgi:hypothetical protein